MRVPRDVYQSSLRKFDGSPVELTYPSEYLVRKINQTGGVNIHRACIAVSQALRGFEVGLQTISANELAVWFCRLRLGEIDLTTQKFHATTAAARAAMSPAANQ
jgi:hypothetical protein